MAAPPVSEISVNMLTPEAEGEAHTNDTLVNATAAEEAHSEEQGVRTVTRTSVLVVEGESAVSGSLTAAGMSDEAGVKTAVGSGVLGSLATTVGGSVGIYTGRTLGGSRRRTRTRRRLRAKVKQVQDRDAHGDADAVDFLRVMSDQGGDEQNQNQKRLRFGTALRRLSAAGVRVRVGATQVMKRSEALTFDTDTAVFQGFDYRIKYVVVSSVLLESQFPNIS